MDALIREVLTQARGIAEDVQRRLGVTLRAATVVSTGPLVIRYDGEDDPAVVTPRSVVTPNAGERVLVAKSRGQATVLGVLAAGAQRFRWESGHAAFGSFVYTGDRPSWAVRFYRGDEWVGEVGQPGGKIDSDAFAVQSYQRPLELIGEGGSHLRLRADGSGPHVVSQTVYDRTYSSSSNVHVTPFGTIGRSTSSLRYKRDVRDWTPDPAEVLALAPRQWHDRSAPDPGTAPWIVGFIAEEVHLLPSLRGLVVYADDPDTGRPRPESLEYDRFAAAQQVVIRDQQDRIEALEERLAAVEAHLAAE